MNPNTNPAKWWLVSRHPQNDLHVLSECRPEGLVLGPFDTHSDLMTSYNRDAEALSEPDRDCDCDWCQCYGPGACKQGCEVTGEDFGDPDEI